MADCMIMIKHCGIAERAVSFSAKPLCAMCLAEGRIVAAKIADHVEPHHNDPMKFWTGALQSLKT